jgi:hypothetical protein
MTRSLAIFIEPFKRSVNFNRQVNRVAAAKLKACLSIKN